jgi:hypothetical protein
MYFNFGDNIVTIIIPMGRVTGKPILVKYSKEEYCPNTLFKNRMGL